MHRAISLCVLGLSGCVLVSNSEPAIDYAPAIRGYAADATQAYTELATQSGRLETALTRVCAEPSETALADARVVFRSTHAAWRASAAFAIGPAMSEGFDADFAFFPARAPSVEANLAAPDEITETWVAELGAAGRGLFAIELLLFSAPGASDTTLDQLADARRCAFVVALGHHGAVVAAQLRDDWTAEPDGFAATFVAGTSRSASMSALITQMIAALQVIKRIQLEKPLGMMDGGVTQPASIEGRLAVDAVDAMRATLRGVHAAWGAGGVDSVAALVRARRADVADAFEIELAEADASLARIDSDYEAYVSGSDTADALSAHTHVRMLERLLATDVSSSLGVMVSLTDSDGD